MAVVVSARGLELEEREFLPFEELAGARDLSGHEVLVEFPNDRDPADLAPWFGRLSVVRVRFPAMGDGRGFSIGARLRALGYAGRLRAAGPLIAGDIDSAARQVEGIENVELELTFDPPWTPDKMSDDAKFILGFG